MLRLKPSEKRAKLSLLNCPFAKSDVGSRGGLLTAASSIGAERSPETPRNALRQSRSAQARISLRASIQSVFKHF